MGSTLREENINLSKIDVKDETGVNQQPIFSARRNYNRWVSNQTLEDDALRFTSKKARRFTFGRVVSTALGGITFLALEAIGGMIALNFGFYNSFLAILAVSLIIFISSLPISYYAAKYGVDIDLLSRGAGFGYIGSTITSLVYALFTFIFFAIEAAIMASVLEMLLDIPIRWGYLISAIVIIPLVTHGITFISRFQVITQPIWVILQIIPFIFILFYYPGSINELANNHNIPVDDSFNILLFGAAAGVLFSFIGQVAEQVDYLRFLPPKTPENNKTWWLAMIASGPGWIIIGILKILAGAFLLVFALEHGLTEKQAINPVYMYSVAFDYISSSPQVTFSLLGIFIILSQLKINVTNAYAGSIAWSNFFSRLTYHHPGRVVWLIFNVIIALLLMQMNIFDAIEHILQAYSIVAVAWIGTLVADLVINKQIGLSPKHIEFRRGYLYAINPVGIGSLIISASIGLALYMGVAGPTLKALAPFITLFITFLATPYIAYITKGKYYLARKVPVVEADKNEVTCLICENDYEKDDIVHCPVSGGDICSLCCSLHSHCYDKCKKPTTEIETEELSILELFCLSPFQMKNKKIQRVVYFTLFISIMAIMITTILWFVKLNAIEATLGEMQLDSILIDIFIFMMIVVTVLAWLFVLTNESRNLALSESIYHTELLREEVIAHNATTSQLQLAKEHAEAANLAKNRYLSGISHELRTPLNSLLGYSQLLERDRRLLEDQKQRISFIRKSGEYLADLIDGLVDISSIEAGKLAIQQNSVSIKQLLSELVQMFTLQANAKGLTFIYTPCDRLPETVITDEKHLKQILINLLSNAIKYTLKGTVHFKVSYSFHVANFIVEDTGVGIKEDNIKLIFQPFERIFSDDTPMVSGTGLGLTITQLLIDIMGGELKVKSQLGHGSHFNVRLFMSPDKFKEMNVTTFNNIIGYEQATQHIAIVDDNYYHRQFMRQMLSPLGFEIVEFESAERCLAYQSHIDLYLVDIFMPLISGWELVKRLRNNKIKTPIIMVSANADEIEGREQPNLKHNIKAHLINDHIMKPVRYEALLNKIERHLNLTWQYDNHLTSETSQQHPDLLVNVPTENREQRKLTNKHILKHKRLLIEMAEVGYVKGLRQLFIEITNESEPNEEMKILKALLSTFQFKKIIQLLKES